MSDSNIKLHDRAYEDIKIGDSFSFSRFIDSDSIARFADFSGDYNPLHHDAEFAKNSEFGGVIAPGMLLSSLFSTLIGMICPGKRAIYLSQDLKFKNPFLPGGEVIVIGTVIRKSDVMRVIEMKTEIKDSSGAILVEGVAKAKVRNHES